MINIFASENKFTLLRSNCHFQNLNTNQIKYQKYKNEIHSKILYTNTEKVIPNKETEKEQIKYMIVTLLSRIEFDTFKFKNFDDLIHLLKKTHNLTVKYNHKNPEVTISHSSLFVFLDILYNIQQNKKKYQLPLYRKQIIQNINKNLKIFREIFKNLYYPDFDKTKSNIGLDISKYLKILKEIFKNHYPDFDETKSNIDSDISIQIAYQEHFNELLQKEKPQRIDYHKEFNNFILKNGYKGQLYEHLFLFYSLYSFYSEFKIRLLCTKCLPDSQSMLSIFKDLFTNFRINFLDLFTNMISNKYDYSYNLSLVLSDFMYGIKANTDIIFYKIIKYILKNFEDPTKNISEKDKKMHNISINTLNPKQRMYLLKLKYCLNYSFNNYSRHKFLSYKHENIAINVEKERYKLELDLENARSLNLCKKITKKKHLFKQYLTKSEYQELKSIMQDFFTDYKKRIQKNKEFLQTMKKEIKNSE